MGTLLRRTGTFAVTVKAFALLLAVAACADPPSRHDAPGRPRRLPPLTQLSADADLPPPIASTEGLDPPQERPALSPPADGQPPPVPLQASSPRDASLSSLPAPGVPWSAGSPRANTSRQGQAWIDPYRSRIADQRQERWWKPEQSSAATALPRPWWDAGVRQPLNARGEPLQIGIAALVAEALRYSSYVNVITTNPLIQHAELTRESAAFDWVTFLETTYNNNSDPVGSALTTGTNADRYLNRDLASQIGVRRRNAWGGEVDAFQRFAAKNDNSRFLTPNPQRTTRLELQYTQPLLRGAGRAYNESLIVLARIQLDRSSDAVADELESHLVKVTEAYWGLYRTRAEFLQRRKLLESARRILANLEGRRAVDAVDRQVFRARTAVANRETEMLRAETRIRNWQSQLRLLVNDPVLTQAGNREFMPVDSPLLTEVPLSMSESLHTALLNRPDISQAVRDAQAASLKLGVAKKDLLPRLDLVVGSYVAGLAAAANGGQAFGNQFSTGRPSYSIGMQFEVPLGKHASKARAERRQLELSQAMSRFSLTVEEALTTVELSVREVETSYREMVANYQAMRAAQQEADYLNDRWVVLPNAGDSAAVLLENLLDAQQRVADQEQAMVNAQINYALALVKLKSEMGTLLRLRAP